MMIITDALTQGFLSTPDANIGIDTASFEALDLLLNLCSNKELFTEVFKETLTHQTLEGLHKSCFDFEFGDPSKQKMAQAKIKQIISDHYVEFSLLN